VEHIFREVLAGKRFGLMGFEEPEATSIISTLGTVRGVGHPIGDASHIPGLNSFSPFDACFVNASAAGKQTASIESLARCRKPAILVGTVEDLLKHFVAVVGVNRDFIVRPFKSEELLLRAYYMLKFVESTAVEIQSATRNGIRHVLLADDDATTNVLVSTILKHSHFVCEIAHDGVQALDIARKNNPDLVVLDVSMPRMNGFEALTALRGDRATRNTPVILLSAHHDEAEVVKGFSLGANDYIAKPFNTGELMARINHILRESEDRVTL
jgi:CheY-like chemotaxis protein